MDAMSGQSTVSEPAIAELAIHSRSSPSYVYFVVPVSVTRVMSAAHYHQTGID